MSEGTQNIGDEQAVVGEPASHPHQAIVVGEPPEDVVPVLGEPAFANGLQDQQPISPPSVDRTSANGIQSTPHVAFHEESSSHVSAPSSAPPVEEGPNLQQVLAAEASESGTGEGVSHQLETPVAETPSPHVDEASSGLTYTETHVAPNNQEHVHSVEEEPIAADIPDVVEVTHIEDSPSAAPSEVPTENPFVALDEGPAADENASGKIIDGDTPVIDGAPAASSSSTADEISLKGLGDQQEESSPLSAVQEKQSAEHLVSAQTDVDDGSKAANEDDVHATELEKVGQGDALAQESEAKEANLEEEETGPSVMEHLLAPELDQASERDAIVQGHDGSEDVLVEPETREVEHVSSRDVPLSEVSMVELSTSQKDVPNENHAAPIASELPSSNETLVEAALADSCVAAPGTRAIVVEECLVTQPPTEEFPPAANGNNGYQHFEDGDGALEREQDLSKEEEDDHASAEVGKPISRIKLPLIFTGLAIAAVGVAVASISRTH